jgi:hypothetical protein
MTTKKEEEIALKMARRLLGDGSVDLTETNKLLKEIRDIGAEILKRMSQDVGPDLSCVEKNTAQLKGILGTISEGLKKEKKPEDTAEDTAEEPKDKILVSPSQKRARAQEIRDLLTDENYSWPSRDAKKFAEDLADYLLRGEELTSKTKLEDFCTGGLGVRATRSATKNVKDAIKLVSSKQ